MRETNAQRERLEKVLGLLEMGLNIIPLKPSSKIASRPWKRWQTERVSHEQIELWWSENNDWNWAVVCGAISNVVCVDADDDEALKYIRTLLPYTPVRQRSSRGEHWLYRYNPDFKFLNIKKLKGLNLDIKTNGGIFVAPLSIHSSGFVYEEASPWSAELLREMPVFNPALLGIGVATPEAPTGLDDYEPTEDTSDAQRWLTGQVGSIQGHGKGADAYCFALALTLVQDFALSADDATALLYEWGQKADNLDLRGGYYPWTMTEIEHKVKGALAAINPSRLGCRTRAEVLDHEAIAGIVKEVEIPTKGKDEKKTDKSVMLNWNEYHSKYGAMKVEYIIDDLLPSVGLTLFSGSPFSGKTTLVDYMIACICSSEPFLKFNSRPLPILFFDYDFNHVMRIKRLTRFANEQDLCRWFSCADSDQLPDTLTASVLAALIDKPCLVLIDTMRAGLFGDIEAGGENDNVLMTKVLKPYRKLAINTQSAIMLLHHNNRSRDDFAGASGIAGLTAALWNYQRDECSSIGKLLTKTREKVNIPVHTEMDDGYFKVYDAKERIDNLVASLPIGKPLTLTEIIKITGLARGTAERQINVAVDRQQLVIDGERKKGKTIHYRRAQ